MNELDKLIQAVLASPKYRNICVDVIRNIGLRELSKQADWKEAVKATKNKLHQIGGAYLYHRIGYTRWLEKLQAAVQLGDRSKFLHLCMEIMRQHSSTRERLKVLDKFYVRTLADLPHIDTVLDIACGLNPLAIPWMPFDKDVKYYAFDMYKDMVCFLNQFMRIANVHGEALVCDVTQLAPTCKADVAFILKSLPCIEQLDKSASLRLLNTVNVDYLLISFPVRSLGGKNKGMVRNYEAQFWELLRGKPWSVRRFEFATELAFLVSK